MSKGKGRSHGQETAPPSRRLVAIMFTDLVGYSAMAHRDEALAIELLELHRSWVREILPLHGGTEIETVGDGFLIEFTGALSAVECAVAIQRRFAEYNAAAKPERRMELRIGVHLGDVEHKGDKVFGDGVNIASRIHGMAKPGGICVSEDVHHAVRNRPAFQFTSLGTPPLKNITTALELFELAPSLSLAPPVDVASAHAPQPAAKARPRWAPLAAAVAGGIAALALAFGAGWLVTKKPHGDLPAIAVLPFDNLSADPDSAFFTDGLHDTVIGHLSRVAGLKVISRTSVMGYRGQHSNLKRIAQELGVTSILEGSVQRSGNKLRVAAQLIDTETDTHIWSNEYDRELSDVFAVQADIAEQVASAVKVKLTPQEQASIQSIPTKNQAAYDLYLRAVVVTRLSQIQPDKVRDAIGWLDEAVKLDPGFALAWSLLAFLHDDMHWFGYDPSDERRRLAQDAAETALRLAPTSAEAHVAKALNLYHGSRNYDAAIKELEIARGFAPGDANVAFWLGPIYRRQARWDEALATLERASALDPLNAQYLFEYANTLQMLRRYPEAQTGLERLATLQPDEPTLPSQVAYNHFLQTGDLAPVAAALTKIPATFDPGCQVSQFRMGMAMLQRRFDEASRFIAGCKEPVLVASGGEQVPREFYIATVEWFGSGGARAPSAARARTLIEPLLAKRPDQPGVRMSYAFTLLMLGDRERAIAETDRALAQLPLSRDALSGAQILQAAAQLHANAGATERALGELEQVARLPGGANVEEMKLDPVYDPLRKEPRFQQLVARAVAKN